MSGSIFGIVAQQESSGGVNTYNPQSTSSGNAEGWFGITTGTWNDFAPGAGVSLSDYPTPNDAPESVQQQVASDIPLSRWAGSTQSAVQTAFGGSLDPSQTLGQLDQQTGGSGTPLSASPAGGAPIAGTGGASPATGSTSGGGDSGTTLGFPSFTRIATVVVGCGVLFVGLAALRSGRAPVQIVTGAVGKIAKTARVGATAA